VDRALSFGVGSVELVPQHDPHLGQIFHTAEVFLDRVVDGEGKDSFGIISSLLESFTGMLKVAVIDFATSSPSGVCRKSLGRLLFFASHDFPYLH